MAAKRAALYLRVSTLDQHPETQLHDLRQLAQQRGLEIIVTYTDYLSSTKIRRPKLEQMLADARQGKFQVLLVWACDRLARSVRHFLEVLDELNHLGVEFVSFREQLDTGGPLGRAVVIIVGARPQGEARRGAPQREFKPRPSSRASARSCKKSRTNLTRPAPA